MANLTEEPLSNISESSFVILGQGSLPSDVNNGFHENSFESQKDDYLSKMGNSGGTTLIQSSDANLLDNNVEEKLKKLYEENYNLKETLNQNNLAIKSQLHTFIMWQREVLKTHEIHKQKFLETKNLILKLRAENINLKKQLENNSNVEIKKDHQTFSYCANANMSNSDLNNSNEKVSKMEANVDSSSENENLNEINHKLVEKLKDAGCQIVKLSDDLENATKENNLLKKKVEELQRNSSDSFLHVALPNFEARAQISNLFKQLDEEREKTTKLKEELELLKCKQHMTDDNLSTTEELTEYINKLDDMNWSFDKRNQRYKSLSSWISLAEENLNAVREEQPNEGFNEISSEIARLKSLLNKETNASEKKQERLQEMQSQFSRLLQDYKDFRSTIDLLKKDDENIEQIRDELTRLKSQLKTKNEELELKKHQIEELQKNIKELNLKCEETEILRVQVQVYETDFNDERQARERLVGEKEEMAEQIRLLQSKIQDFEKKKKNNSENDSTKSVSPTNEKEEKYVCPTCMVTFSDFKKCEEHVEECINILLP